VGPKGFEPLTARYPTKKLLGGDKPWIPLL